jgi:tetratricopeptide (TPR) repeat protein
MVFSLVLEAAAIALLLLTGTPVAAGRGQAPTNVDADVANLARQAQEAEGRRDYRSAAQIYQKILTFQPDLPEVQANLGLMYFLLGQYVDARHEFEASLRQKPSLFVPNLFLGLDMLKLGKAREALPHLLKAQQLSPSDENAALGLGKAYAAIGEFEKANNCYFHAVEISPGNTDALFGLGTSYLDIQKSSAQRIAKLGRNSFYGQMLLAESFVHEGRVPDSIRIYKQLLASNPNRTGLRTNIGFGYIDEAEVSLAKSEFQAEIDSHSGYLPAHLGMARVALEEDNAADCLSELETIWKTDSRFIRAEVARLWSSTNPSTEEALKRRLHTLAATEPIVEIRRFLLNSVSSSNELSLAVSPRNYPQGSSLSASLRIPGSASATGLALFNSGDYASAGRILGEDFNRLDLPALLLMAECSYLDGDYLPVLKASEKALASDPNNLAALYWKAEATEKLAIDALTRAGLADPNSYRTHLILAQKYRSEQNYQASEMEYRAALELNPSDQGAHLGLATTYWEELKFDQALGEVRPVLTTHPEDTQANYILGEILVARHQYAEARPHLLAATGGEGNSGLHAHALLSKVYAAQGNLHWAIKELETGLPADDDGSLHFQLFRLYEKVGDHDKARVALQQSQALRKQLEDRARHGVELGH